MTNAHGNRHVVVTSIERAPLDTVDAFRVLDAGQSLELPPE